VALSSDGGATAPGDGHGMGLRGVAAGADMFELDGLAELPALPSLGDEEHVSAVSAVSPARGGGGGGEVGEQGLRGAPGGAKRKHGSDEVPLLN
jgi:hypothetical protein